MRRMADEETLLLQEPPAQTSRWIPESSETGNMNFLQRLASSIFTARHRTRDSLLIDQQFQQRLIDETNNDNSLPSPGTLQRVTRNLILTPNIIESSWKNNIAFTIDATPIGRLWEVLDGLINVVFCSLYIYNTTFAEHEGLPYSSRLASLILAMLLLLQYLPRFIIAVDLVHSLFSVMSIMTLISTVPVIIAFFDQSVLHTYMSAGNYVFIYPFRFVRLHLILMTLLTPSKTSIFRFSLITRKSVQLVAFLLFMIMTTAAFVHMVVLKTTSVEDHFSFFDSFFFAIISATSGYSSKIVPDSTFARLVTLYVLISGVIIVPKSLAELLTLINKKSAYDHSFKHRKHQNHVVICGRFELNSLRSFLKEFFCQDHGNSTLNTHIVILNPLEPSEELKMILEDPFYLNRVQYVRGSAMDAKSLVKVRISEAKACFIFSSKYATVDAVEEDASAVMRALSLKKQAPSIPLHAQVLLPEHKPHFDHLADTMICIEELKMGLLAQGCRCHGLITLINLLTTSLTESNAIRLIESTNDKESQWLREYIQGANQEIYPTTISIGFRGFKFSKVSSMIYRNFGATVFALGIPNKSFYEKFANNTNTTDKSTNTPGISEFDLIINPGDYSIAGGEVIFIIASNQRISRLIADFNPDDVQYLMSIDAPRTSHSLIKRLLKKLTKTNDDVTRSPPALTKLVPNHAIINNQQLSNSNEKLDLLFDRQVSNVSNVSNVSSDLVKRILQQAIGNTDQTEKVSNKCQTRNQTCQTLPQEISDHYLVCDPGPCFPANLEYFIAPLRTPHLLHSASSARHQTDNSQMMPPICILCSHRPTERQQQLLEGFENVYLVIGSPMSRRDLERAGVRRCRKAIVLADSSKGQSNIERTVDAPSLLVVLNIEAMTSSRYVETNNAHNNDTSLFVISEFIQYENVAFAGDSLTLLLHRDPSINNDTYSQTIMRPAFMAGHVYAQCMLDTVICQNYYNPHLLNILRHLLFSGIFVNDSDANSDANSDGTPKHSHVWLVEIPAALEGVCYVDLFDYLCQQLHAVPIGLYRTVPLNDTNDKKKKSNYYVYVNPAPTTLLRQSDRVYCLCAVEPILL